MEETGARMITGHNVIHCQMEEVSMRKFLGGIVALVALLAVSPQEATTQVCRRCDFDDFPPECVLVDKGQRYCDDVENDKGKCILLGGECETPGKGDEIAMTGSAARSEVTETLVKGDLVIRRCDRAVVAQRLDGEARRAARQAAARIVV